jgi:ERCC4-type nuclease
VSFLVAPSEPKALRQIGETSQLAELYGADILIPAKGFFIGVQRKVFPGDFLSSLSDGRLQTSLVKLTKTEVRILVLEGQPAWATSGYLVGHDYGQGASFSQSQLRSLILSAYHELGILTLWTTGLSDTIACVEALAQWGAKDKHNSLFTRPGPVKLTRRFSERDRAVHILQGFDGIGPELAGNIYDYFGRIPLRWDITPEQMMEVDGIGKGRAEKLKGALGE